MPFIILALMSLSAWGSGYYNTTFGYRKKLSIRFTTTPQTILASNCSGAVSIRSFVGTVATNVTTPISIDLTATGGIGFYSDSYCTTPITNATIGIGSNTTTFYFLSDIVGNGVITAEANTFPPLTQTETMNTNPYIWIGNGANANWNTAANWSGGVAPTSGQIAVFNTACVTNCSPTTTANVSVGGVRLAPGYSGTLTQGTGFTISSSHWTQLSGTFQGSNANITHTDFNLYGGSYTASSGTTTFNGHYTVSGSPTLNLASSNFNFVAQSSYRTLTPASFNYENVSVTASAGCYSKGHNLNGTFRIKNFTVNCSDGYTYGMQGGTVEVSGDVLLNGKLGGSSILTLTGTGSVTSSGATFGVSHLTVNTSGTYNLVGTIFVTGNYTYTSGTINAGTSKVIFSTTSSQTIVPGPTNFNDVELGGHNGCYSIFQAITGTLKVNNLSTYCATAFRAWLTAGTIEVSGNVTAQGQYVGGGVIKMVGSGTITGIAGSRLPGFIIDTVGTYALTGDLRFAENFTIINGTVNAGTSNLMFAPNDNNITQTIDSGTAQLSNVQIGDPSNCYTVKQQVTGTMKAQNLTLFCSDNNTAYFLGGTIDVAGDLTVSGKFEGGGVVRMIGSGTITGTTDLYLPNLVMDTSGTYALAGNIGFLDTYTYVSGTINPGTSTLHFRGLGKTIVPGPVTYANVILGRSSCSSTGIAISGTLTTKNLIFSCGSTATHNINTGAIDVLENVSMTANTRISGTAVITMIGGTPGVISQDGGNSLGLSYTINKTAGTTVSLGSAVNLNKSGTSLSVVSGNVNMAGNNLTLSGSLSLNGNTLTKNTGVLTVGGVVAGTGSLYGGTVNP